MPPAPPPPPSPSADHAAPAIARRINLATDLATLVDLSGQFGGLLIALAAEDGDAVRIGATLSALNDRLTSRLLGLAEARLGPPPVAYAWLACGSQGRAEQTVHSDQDNALILDDRYRPDAHGEYFATLAGFVSDGLNACGFRYCAGDVMASNPRWRLPRAAWEQAFCRWIDRPDRRSAMLVANFADLRVVHGNAQLLAPVREVLHRHAPRSTLFLAHLAANALANRPPASHSALWPGGLARFAQLAGLRSGRINLKRAGLLPISDMARVHALANGVTDIATLDRLRAAAGGRGLSRDGARRLADAFVHLGRLRVLSQAAQLAAGRPPDNELDPQQLAGNERTALADALATVRLMQASLARHYPALPDR